MADPGFFLREGGGGGGGAQTYENRRGGGGNARPPQPLNPLSNVYHIFITLMGENVKF